MAKYLHDDIQNDRCKFVMHECFSLSGSFYESACFLDRSRDVNSLLDYPRENDACSHVYNTILENSVEDDIDDDTTLLEPITHK